MNNLNAKIRKYNDYKHIPRLDSLRIFSNKDGTGLNNFFCTIVLIISNTL